MVSFIRQYLKNLYKTTANVNFFGDSIILINFALLGITIFITLQ